MPAIATVERFSSIDLPIRYRTFEPWVSWDHEILVPRGMPQNARQAPRWLDAMSAFE